MLTLKKYDNMFARLVLVFFFLALGIGSSGYLYYSEEKRDLKKNIGDELSAIADLKVSQIAAWRNGIIEDARSISENEIVSAAIQQYFLRPDTPGLRARISSWMQSVQDISNFKNVFLTDARGNIRLSTVPRREPLGPKARTWLDEALHTKQPFFSDMHAGSAASYVHLDIIAPLILDQGHIRRPVGALFIHVDPGKHLYPLIQQWPGSSTTAEIILFRKDGDNIVYLNELRHRKNTALTLQVPDSTKFLPEAMAVAGKTGVFEGIDYRGVPVLAATRSLPGTPWFLVSKVDIGEIYAPIRKQAAAVSIVFSILIAASGFIILLWWRQKNAEYLQKQYASELERKTLSQQYDVLSKYANDIILLVDPAGAIVEANDKAASSYGYSREELRRLTIRDIRTPETRSAVDAHMDRIWKQNGSIFETFHCRKDGTAFPVEVSSRVIDVEGKKYFQSIIRDISERKQVEQTLVKRNEIIEVIMDNLPIGLAMNRISDGATLYMNSTFEKIYGWPKEVILNIEDFFSHVYPDPVYRAEIRSRVLADIASGDPARMRWDGVTITTMTGEQRLITAINIPLPGQDLMISTVQDTTLQKQAEQALIESEKRYKRLVESLTDYMYSVDVEQGRAVSTVHGPGCVAVTGYTSEEYEQDPELWSRMIFAEDRRRVIDQANKILSGAPAPFIEHRILHKDGSLRWVRNTPVPRCDKEGRIVSYDGLITDITQVKLLENQLRQAQKMEAVGQLAGGVAHDFNNILTAIIGYGNLVLMKMPQADIGRSYVEQILSSAERAAHLTHSLLAFSRKQIIDLKPANVNEIIRRVGKLLQRIIGEDIELQLQLCREEPMILADGIQIEQVLMNLATNARDAMPDGGTLRINTEEVELGEQFVRAHAYGKPGRYALISMTDAGIGMDETTKNRIFEPFFTTKEVGKGTGLGLAMVYGITKQHEGYILVNSEPGEGTTFKIYFPRILPIAEGTSSEKVVTVPRGIETVLLAEDDGAVRQLTNNVLEDFGYQVIEAVDGEDAIKKFLENRDRIQLLVLDIVMPKKNGKEVYQEIRKIQPGIKVLFTSGYTADIIHRKGILETGLDFILKPISPAIFLKKVREVLDK
jgi:two-component system cell cycle sensor histidine kinase/response regulator CckA